MTDRTCSIDECAKPHLAKGLCGMHYRRQRAGVPLNQPARLVGVAPLERLMSRVEKREGGCWIYIGAKSSDGYGSFWDGRIVRSAHRAAYEMSVGPIPDGLELDHLCRVRDCVNPEHTEPVTHAENVARGSVSSGVKAWYAARTECPNGHTYTPEATGRHGNGRRACLACLQEKSRRQSARRRDIRRVHAETELRSGGA